MKKDRKVSRGRGWQMKKWNSLRNEESRQKYKSMWGKTMRDVAKAKKQAAKNDK